MTLLTARTVRDLLAEGGVTARRRLGQHFLVDPNTVRRIVRLAGVGPRDRVLEIGPGLGSLTLGLVEAGATVVAVEKDPGIAALARSVLPPEVDLVVCDAMKADLAGLTTRSEGPWHVVANLPYNVATPLVLRVLDEVPSVVRMLVMVQAEVADRLVAGPGDPAYGIPSLRVTQHASARIVGRVGPDVFLPRPRVTSALVELSRRPSPLVPVADEAAMWSLVRTAFSQRRKTVRRSLAGLVDLAALEAAGIDPSARPGSLSLVDFARLSEPGSATGEVSR